jgi:hypothetical protein
MFSSPADAVSVSSRKQYPVVYIVVVACIHIARGVPVIYGMLLLV